MASEYKIRPATIDDAKEIAKLIAISSDGVATIEWNEQAVEGACDPLDIGERSYQNPQGDYSYSKAIMVDENNQVAGMLLTFGIARESAIAHATLPLAINPGLPPLQ